MERFRAEKQPIHENKMKFNFMLMPIEKRRSDEKGALTVAGKQPKGFSRVLIG